MLELNRVFDEIKNYIKDDVFKETFPIIITDNGSEFHDPASIETSIITGEQLIHIYYCEPRRSDQKGKCKKNHEHIRELIPKGISMERLTQKDIRYVSIMINNYPRAQFNFHSPYQIISPVINKKVLELNRLTFVHPNAIVLKPIVK